VETSEEENLPEKEKPTFFETGFLGSGVFGGTFPGLKRPSGQSPRSRSVSAIYSDEANLRLSIYLTNVEGYLYEDADFEGALAKAAGITAAYEMTKRIEAENEFDRMKKIFSYASDAVTPIRKDLDMPNKKVEMIGATLYPTTDKEYWRLAVSNNGRNHCLVINPQNDKFESMRPGLPRPGSTRAVENPTEEEFIAGTGEIVVLANDMLVEAFGGEEKLSESILEMLKKGESAADIRRKLLDDVVSGQIQGSMIDSSVSLNIFEVPPTPEKSKIRGVSLESILR